MLVFLTVDCPIANQYAPELARLCRDYTTRGVLFYAVYVDPETSEAQAQQHARAFGLSCLVLCDPQHRLVQEAGATITPEAAVFTPDRKRRYRGRIDDRFPRLGQRRASITSPDLRNALDAVLAGKPVATPLTRAVGCLMPTLKEKKR